MSRRLRLEAWLHVRREAWRAAFVRGPWTMFVFEFVSFGIKQAWACLFGGIMLALLLGTHLLWRHLWPTGNAPSPATIFFFLPPWPCRRPCWH